MRAQGFKPCVRLLPSALAGGTDPAGFTVTATQSSRKAGSPAATAAIDGNTDYLEGSASCTHTNIQSNPWFRIDLGEVRTVTQVKIFNMGGHPKFRTSPIEVTIGTSTTGGVKCGTIRTLATSPANNINVLVNTPTTHILDAGAMLRVSCPQLPPQPRTVVEQKAYSPGGGLSGRYVTIKALGPGKRLTLCEVQVFGSLGMAPNMDQGVGLNGLLNQGGGVPIDPCSVDMRMQSSGVTRNCPE